MKSQPWSSSPDVWQTGPIGRRWIRWSLGLGLPITEVATIGIWFRKTLTFWLQDWPVGKQSWIITWWWEKQFKSRNLTNLSITVNNPCSSFYKLSFCGSILHRHWNSYKNWSQTKFKLTVRFPFSSTVYNNVQTWLRCIRFLFHITMPETRNKLQNIKK